MWLLRNQSYLVYLKNIFELEDPQKVGDLQSPLVAQWIKDPACGHGQKKKKKK